MSNKPLVSNAVMAVYKRVRGDRWYVAPGQTAPRLELAVRNLPRYLSDRATLKRSRQNVPADTPWITDEAIAILDDLLQPSFTGLEFGSGGSTAWCAQRIGSLISVEANDGWYAEVVRRLATAGVQNVSYHLASSDVLGFGSDAHRSAYVDVRPDLAPNSLDFVFVDGDYRDHSALRGLSLLKPGGMIVLDNASLYLPNDSRTPWKVSAPASAEWARFLELTAGWKHVWTTNGVWDTAFWFKP